MHVNPFSPPPIPIIILLYRDKSTSVSIATIHALAMGTLPYPPRPTSYVGATL